jgi:hypothetical protein
VRRIVVSFFIAASLIFHFTLHLSAQPVARRLTQQSEAPGSASGRAGRPAIAAAPVKSGVLEGLPVRKVVLYKNGVGYFEHGGTVSGNQRVTIDFTSSQLNDVLESLTALDSKGGKVGAMGYNSTSPVDQQLNTLGLGLKDYPVTVAVYHALRGQRVEVSGAGAPLTGRLVNIEFRKETDKNGATSEDHYYLIVATDAGALRTAELTDAVSVRMLDLTLQKQFADYLGIVASGQYQQVRRLTLEDRGEGERELSVSYISEVPVWKSTYRIVFPRTANGRATMQGWAVVDNTVGADWDNVQLSLVAGAPQSFIQPLSQPLFVRRPEIPIATVVDTAPQTHEAAELSSPVVKAASPRSASVMQGIVAGGVAQMARGSAFDETLTDTGGEVIKYAGGSGAGSGGGVNRVSDAMQEGDVSTNAFDDFFEYALTAPVTIHKNESAMVPILQQELPAEHVTLWSENGRSPLRAVWLENTSKLTLDESSFSIFESGEFAGEGLLDPIHPGEKRLLSYAADQAVRVKVNARDPKRTLEHVKIAKGVVVETHIDVASETYAATNAADVDRVVLIEHARRGHGLGWGLDDGLTAAEASPNLYRFRLPVAAHATATLEVREHGPEMTTVHLNGDDAQTVYLLDLVKQVPDAMDKLKPLINAQTELADLNRRIGESKSTEETSASDEARDRENLTALKGSDAAKRFVDELNRAEDQLKAARKQAADLEQQKQVGTDKLNALLAGLSFDWSVTKN